MSLHLQPGTTALVIIDLEHAIVGRDGKPYPTSHVVGNASKLAQAMRDAGGMVVYVHVLLSEFLPHEVDTPMQMPAQLPANASELVPEAG